MLHTHLITQPAPPLQLSNTARDALQLLDDTRHEYWPVVHEGIYKGLVAEEILLDIDEATTMDALQNQLIDISVNSADHYMIAAERMTERRLYVLPVTTDEGEYLGVIQGADMLQQLAQLTGAHMPGGMVVLEVSPLDFSPGEISRLIETNDAQLRHLNTQLDEATGLYIVTIRINKLEISDIIATLQRYDYKVVFFAGEEQYENELRRNYNHLLHYLDI